MERPGTLWEAFSEARAGLMCTLKRADFEPVASFIGFLSNSGPTQRLLPERAFHQEYLCNAGRPDNPLQPGKEQFFLEEQLLGERGMQADEKLFLRNDFLLPLIGIDLLDLAK